MNETGLILNEAALLTAHGCASDNELVKLWLSSGKRERTRAEYARDVTEFRAFIQMKPLRELTMLDLQQYETELKAILIARKEGKLAKPLAWRTQHRKLATIKSLLAFGQRCGYLQYNVGTVLKPERQADDLTERISTEETITRIIALETNPRNRMLCKLAYASGGRVSELVRLKWKDTAPNGNGGQLTLFGKGGKTRHVVLPAGVWRELLSLQAKSGAADPVFVSRRADGKTGAGAGHLTKVQAWRIVKAAAIRAGAVEAFSPHWFRHAHISHALQRGANPALVRDTVGHASLETTSRYAHARPQESSAQFLALD